MASNSISRKEFLKILGSSAFLPIVGQSQPARPGRSSDDLPNVILIISDDHAPGALGVLDPLLKIPNLDKLARSGVRFSNAFTNTSICAPGRACIMTGLYSRQNGVIDNEFIPKRRDSLLPLLQKAGYLTGFSGKLHWPMVPDPSEFGFDWRGAMVPGASLFGHPTFAYYGQDKKPARISKEEGDTAITDAAISFLESNRDKRFFLWLAYFSVHAPLLMPKKFQEMYDPNAMKLPPNFVSKHEGPMLAGSTGTTAYGGPVTDPELIKKGTALYYGMLSYLDEQIGRVLDSLQKLGLSRKTLIVFVGDNGFMLGNQGYAGKGFLYEESIKAPLLFTWPGKIKPRVVDELVYQMDILPTVMEAARAPVPPGLAGKSLLPLLQGKRARLREEVFCELYPRKWKAVRTREWKYIATPELGEELYRLTEDPYEMKNLAGEEKHRAVLEKLRGDWSRWEKEVGEPKGGQEERAQYIETIKRERGRLVKLVQENDYDPQLAMDIGGFGFFAWLDVLGAEGKRSPELNALVEKLLHTTYAQQVNSKAVRATMSEFLKEIVRCESGSAR